MVWLEITEDYGPWMLVQRQRRKSKLAMREEVIVGGSQVIMKGKSNFQVDIQGSRFISLANFEEGDLAIMGNMNHPIYSIDQPDKAARVISYNGNHPRQNRNKEPTNLYGNMTSGGSKGTRREQDLVGERPIEN